MGSGEASRHFSRGALVKRTDPALVGQLPASLFTATMVEKCWLADP